jgi:predicted nucleic acid-binding protein
MTRCLVLDSEALSALGEPTSRRQTEVRAALHSAARLGRQVFVPAVVLAELYRGPFRNHMVDACLARETGLNVRDTDRKLAKLVGSALASAQLGSSHIVDAHLVATAAEVGGGVILTTDSQDLSRLAAAYPNVTVVFLP